MIEIIAWSMMLTGLVTWFVANWFAQTWRSEVRHKHLVTMSQITSRIGRMHPVIVETLAVMHAEKNAGLVFDRSELNAMYGEVMELDVEFWRISGVANRLLDDADSIMNAGLLCVVVSYSLGLWLVILA